MPTGLRLSCRALLIIVLVRPNFYSALLAGRFGCFSCLSTFYLQKNYCQDTCWFVPKWSRQFICWRAMSLCHMFADIFKDDEPGDITTELFLYKLIIQQALLIFACLYPHIWKSGGTKFFFLFCTPTLKSAAAPWRDLHFSFYSLPSTCLPQLSWAPGLPPATL